MPSLPWRTCLLTLLSIGLFMIFGSAPDILVYKQETISNGELWRLFSGHWVHSDLQHAQWDIAALLILGSLFEQTLRRQLFSVLMLSCLIISISIIVFMPGLMAYCGLSGILNSLFSYGILQLWKSSRSAPLLLILLAGFLKNLIELHSHEAIFTDTLWPSVPEAHLLGLLTGVILFLISTSKKHHWLTLE